MTRRDRQPAAASTPASLQAPSALANARRLPWEVLALLFVLVLSISPVVSDDVWIYMKTGELTWSTKALISTDDFSFTQQGAPWVNHEWLANLVFFGAHAAAGPTGLIALRALLLLGTFAFLLRIARRAGSSPPLTALCVAAIAFAMSDRFIDRAHLFNFLAIAFYLDALTASRDGAVVSRWRLPIVQALWVNLHSGAIVGPMLTAMFLGVAILRALFARQRIAQSPAVRRFAVTLGLVVAASLLNPYFAGSLLYPFHQAGFDLYRQHVYEWMPITAPAYAGSWMQILFFVSLLATLAAAALPGRARGEEILVAIFFFALAQSAARFTAKFELVALPLFFWRIRGLAPRTWVSVTAGGLVLAGAALIIVFGNPIRGPIRRFGTGVEDRLYPEGACRILESLPDGARLFNQYDLGSYLIGRLYPRVRVFIDGRNQVYPERFYARYLGSNESPANFRALEDEYGIDAVLLYNEPAANIPGFLSLRPEWRLVWFDDNSVLFLKDRPSRRAILDAHGYRLFSPVARAPGADFGRAFAADSQLLRAELERAAREAPNAIVPRAILAETCRRLGRLDEARAWDAEASTLRDRFGLRR